jgi:hypothetical protein
MQARGRDLEKTSLSCSAHARLYYNLGGRHLQTVPNLAASNFFGAAIFSDTKVNFDGSVLRARVSYKF